MQDEAKTVHYARNALIAAGHEMGAEGDHWPAIKATIHGIMQSWEQLQIERNVDRELAEHYGDILNRLDAVIASTPDSIRPELEKIALAMRDSYAACFDPVKNFVPDTPDRATGPWQRLQEIVKVFKEEKSS